MKIRSASIIILTASAAALTFAVQAGNLAINRADSSSRTSENQAPALRPAGPPQYQIFDIGVVQPGDEFSQGFGVSPTAGIAVGRSLNNTGSEAFSWTGNG